MAGSSWLSIPKKSHFSIANIPFGIISTRANAELRVAIAIGDHALDLSAFAQAGGFSKLTELTQQQYSVFSQPSLNAFAALGRPVHKAVRGYLQSILDNDTPYPEVLKTNAELQQRALIPLNDVQMHLPMTIGDYTDFYAGRNHAFNVGVLFRGPENALQPNYNHLPVAYHGRASSIVVSGTAIRRPNGQVLPALGATKPVFRPSGRVDMELEMGMFITRGNALGQPVKVGEAHSHIFGFVLLNDWSARDIQQWEYVPLGPFNSKNFGTTISPWVVLPEALEPFRSEGLKQEIPLQTYLQEERKDNVFDISLEVDLTTSKGNTTTIARTSSTNLLWSWSQMVAHHTITGCNMRVGDLLGSGTISGVDEGTFGSMLEQNRAGKQTIKLSGTEERTFIEDGDTITIRGWAGETDEGIVGFGECTGTILPAVEI